MRKALSLPPSYGVVTDDQDAYLPALQLRPLARQHERYWAFHGLPTTVALPNNRFAKSLASFTSHTDEPSFRELLREYSDYGVPRPSGYADVFHETFKSPRVPYSTNARLAPCFAGGWQECLSPGVHLGTHYKYDMRSAYLWAATLGFPDPSTYVRSLSPWKAAKNGMDGVYRVKLIRPSPDAPFPYNVARECLATNLEIESYDLCVSEVIEGVAWRSTIPGDSIVSAIRKVSTWKECGRAYWGRWAQTSKVECVSPNKKWTLPNICLNVPWAHLIVSRVKMRLWEHSSKAVHVFVDSVLTQDKIPTGMAIGDWRLEKTYHHGVIVRGPGQYGCLLDRQLERFAGASQGSPRRDNPVANVA